ncbi:ubiquitin fusion degradation protein UFD1-domain-containing protein [Phakopsora pachyrhizi]|uniref:Ubiquitin fusion degradation protein UFD1-domain-containing protein n=1 Tax=Phakopsora pachyrhizi TaxID=170000 RepID=A0AAV0BEW5_PHAPC|nr:ubiquitin fusion degradation protein UFD1-domain-containing protein [Phakopsora pachyrhizi]CAH7667469.1 ubiquitin fusion degradation protein UFD1-domain-containing protein [Phakopsora pachyrhizi]CAH7683894.1 ubiquitin fusion degradation protein UFD1-domain-containing protein [Phakopsora pachyrhizi]
MDFDGEDDEHLFEDEGIDDGLESPDGMGRRPPNTGFPGILNSLTGFGSTNGFNMHNGDSWPHTSNNGMGFGNHPMMRVPARAFSTNYRAYSTAILEIKEGRGERTGGRSNVMHGGKIIMPQDALLQLTEMDMDSPFMFEIRNSLPSKKDLFTHCGVLEFIADPGTVHLPQWMMRRLELNEGDPIKLTGARLPKGKFAKVQAQSTLFLELGDHKAVLETALRNFSCLTKGDIIEIYHNMMIFEILIMELKPDDAPGVSIFETDLEVDFAPPVGYVEPAPTSIPVRSTMASKMNINTSDTQSVNARGSGTNTPSGSGSVGNSGAWEAFKGGGRTMGGKQVKGKGISKKKIEEVDASSKIFRTNVQRVVTADTQIGDRHVPARLDLPFGTLFFGYKVRPYQPVPLDDEKR